MTRRAAIIVRGLGLSTDDYGIKKTCESRESVCQRLVHGVRWMAVDGNWAHMSADIYLRSGSVISGGVVRLRSGGWHWSVAVDLRILFLGVLSSKAMALEAASSRMAAARREETVTSFSSIEGVTYGNPPEEKWGATAANEVENVC